MIQEHESELPSEEMIEDHYAALQAWTEWAKNRGRASIPSATAAGEQVERVEVSKATMVRADDEQVTGRSFPRRVFVPSPSTNMHFTASSSLGCGSPSKRPDAGTGDRSRASYVRPPRACRAVSSIASKMATSFCRAGAERPRPSDHAINRMSCSPES